MLLSRQSGSTSNRQEVFELSKRRAMLYNVRKGSCNCNDGKCIDWSTSLFLCVMELGLTEIIAMTERFLQIGSSVITIIITATNIAWLYLDNHLDWNWIWRSGVLPIYSILEKAFS